MPSEHCLSIRGKVIGGGKKPLICTPLIGRDQTAVLAELDTLVSKNPDIIEWRADHFLDIVNSDAVLDLGAHIRRVVGTIPLIFTIRSHTEGGQSINLPGEGVVQLYSRVCESKNIDIIDFELSNKYEHVKVLRDISLASGVKMIMSYHNFSATPDTNFLRSKFAAAESLGADIVKIAVMPNEPGDVLRLLGLTLEASQQLKMPIITMSMGPLGSLTRMAGWIFGSSVTFAVGENSSAPGQVPIEDLRTVLEIMRKYVG